MIRLFEVEIANRMDDHCRVQIMAFSSEDKYGINNVEFIAECSISLNDYSDEYISRVKEIKPLNVASEEKHSLEVSKVFK